METLTRKDLILGGLSFLALCLFNPLVAYNQISSAVGRLSPARVPKPHIILKGPNPHRPFARRSKVHPLFRKRRQWKP